MSKEVKIDIRSATFKLPTSTEVKVDLREQPIENAEIQDDGKSIMFQSGPVTVFLPAAHVERMLAMAHAERRYAEIRELFESARPGWFAPLPPVDNIQQRGYPSYVGMVKGDIVGSLSPITNLMPLPSNPVFVGGFDIGNEQPKPKSWRLKEISTHILCPAKAIPGVESQTIKIDGVLTEEGKTLLLDVETIAAQDTNDEDTAEIDWDSYTNGLVKVTYKTQSGGVRTQWEQRQAKQCDDCQNWNAFDAPRCRICRRYF